MDPLEALLMPVDDDERMRALANSLRGRQVAADFFAGSTIPGIQKMAQAEQKYIQDTANRQGVLRNALANRKQDEAQSKRYEQLQRDMQSAREADNEKDRQLRRDLAAESNALRETMAAMKGARAGSGMKPSAKMVESQLEGMNMLGQIEDLNNIVTNMDEGQLAQLDQPWADIGAGVAESVLPAGVSRRFEEAAFPDEDVREFRALGRRWEQRLSNLAAGLALTRYEIDTRERWSPFARGISQNERQIRMDNLRSEIQEALARRAEMFPEHFEPPTQPAMQPQVESAAPDLSQMSEEELQAELARLEGQ